MSDKENDGNTRDAQARKSRSAVVIPVTILDVILEKLAEAGFDLTLDDLRTLFIDELEMIEQDDLLKRLKICSTSWNKLYKDCKEQMPKRYKYVEGDRTKYRYKKVDVLVWLETRAD